MSQARKCLGEPDEISELEDEIFGEHRLLWHYHKTGLSLFFCKSNAPELRQLECRTKNMTLFRKEVWGISEKDFVSLLKENNYAIDDREVLPWGEVCMSCNKLGLEAYFENKRLQALSFFPVST